MSVSYAIKRSNQKIYDLKETQRIQQELHVEYFRTLMEELMMIPSKHKMLERVLPKTEGELIAALELAQFTTNNDYNNYSVFRAKITNPIYCYSCIEFNFDRHMWLLAGTSNLYFREESSDKVLYNVCEIQNLEESKITLSKIFSNKNQVIKTKNLYESYKNYIGSLCL